MKCVLLLLFGFVPLISGAVLCGGEISKVSNSSEGVKITIKNTEISYPKEAFSEMVITDDDGVLSAALIYFGCLQSKSTKLPLNAMRSIGLGVFQCLSDAKQSLTQAYERFKDYKRKVSDGLPEKAKAQLAFEENIFRFTLDDVYIEKESTKSVAPLSHVKKLVGTDSEGAHVYLVNGPRSEANAQQSLKHILQSFNFDGSLLMGLTSVERDCSPVKIPGDFFTRMNSIRWGSAKTQGAGVKKEEASGR